MSIKKEIEREVKVLNLEEGFLSDLKDRLAANNVPVIGEEKQVNYVFTNGRDKVKMRINDQLIYATNKRSLSMTLITKTEIKGSKKVKNMEEKHLQVASVTAGFDMLKFMGYEMMFVGEKKRVIYKTVDGIEFHFDKWDENVVSPMGKVYPYPYVEIEIPGHTTLKKVLSGIWSKKEQKNLIISTDSILKLSVVYQESSSKVVKYISKEVNNRYKKSIK
jgi:adenylate cyclase class IV